MKRWTHALLAVWLCFSVLRNVSSAAAEATPAPASTPQMVAAVPTIKLSPYLDFLQLKSEVAERNYSTDATNDTFSEYVSSLQESIAAGCMGSLRTTLSYSGFPEDERCRNLIKKTLALDANNPFALCSQNGIDSRECRETMVTIKVGSFDVDAGSWTLDDASQSGSLPPIDLKTALDQKSQHKQIADQSILLQKLAIQLQKRPDLAIRAKYEEVVSKSLLSACVDIRSLVLPIPEKKTSQGNGAGFSPQIFITGQHRAIGAADAQKPVESDATANVPVGTADQSTTADPFSDLLNSMNGSGPAPTPTPLPLKFDGPMHQHVRLVPTSCSRLIKAVPPSLVDLPVVVCNRDGPVSPTCIHARKNAGQTASQKKSPQIYGEGLSTF